jgi:CRP-like cAMP-binding protein
LNAPDESRSPEAGLFEGNLLLEALDTSDRALLAPYLERGQRTRGTVLFRAGEDVSHVTFPLNQTTVTLVSRMRDGRMVETATVGHEGAVGGVVSHGYLPAFSEAVVQVSGEVLRLDAERLTRARAASPTLRDLFVRYADCLLAQVLQSVACNAVHPIEERCLRWLLTFQDRLGTPVLPVTQEMLAEMLGVRRTYLTGVLGALQRRGLISVRRGQITILDRAQAEHASCECYGKVRSHYRSVLGAVYAEGGGIVAVDPTQRHDD